MYYVLGALPNLWDCLVLFFTRSFLGGHYWEDPLEEGMATQTSMLTWRIPTDRGAWWTTAYRVAKELDVTEVT